MGPAAGRVLPRPLPGASRSCPETVGEGNNSSAEPPPRKKSRAAEWPYSVQRSESIAHTRHAHDAAVRVVAENTGGDVVRARPSPVGGFLGERVALPDSAPVRARLAAAIGRRRRRHRDRRSSRSPRWRGGFHRCGPALGAAGAVGARTAGGSVASGVGAGAVGTSGYHRIRKPVPVHTPETGRPAPVHMVPGRCLNRRRRGSGHGRRRLRSPPVARRRRRECGRRR